MFRLKTGSIFSVLGLLLMLVPTASAQILPLSPATITVHGEGSASTPAEEATVVITIGPDSNFYYEDPATMMEAPLDTASFETVDTAGVVDALIAFGIPVNDVTTIESPFMGEWGSGMGAQPATIIVTLSQPTVEGISELLAVVRDSARKDELYVNQFGVLYSVADCRVLRQEARENAFETARNEAQDQADAMNTVLGEVVASRDTVPMNVGYYQTNSCNTTVTAVPYAMSYMVGQFDPTMPAEVTVFIAVEVSFGMQ